LKNPLAESKEQRFIIALLNVEALEISVGREHLLLQSAKEKSEKLTSKGKSNHVLFARNQLKSLKEN